MKKETKELIVQPKAEIQVEFNPEKQVEQARVAAKALMSVIQQKKKPVTFNGEQYLEFEDWQTIAQFYNHTVGIEKTENIEEAGKIIGFVAKAVLYNKDGMIVGGSEAACMKDEPNWKTKPLFQLRSMAQTRAMSKTLRSRFGFVAVLAGFKPTPAEEMDGVTPVNSNVITLKASDEYFCEKHDQTVVLRPAGIDKNGKPFKAFWCCTTKDGGKWCTARLTNSEGQRVKQNPETTEMMVDEANRTIEAEMVSENSVDMARRILNDKVPITKEDMP